MVSQQSSWRTPLFFQLQANEATKKNVVNKEVSILQEISVSLLLFCFVFVLCTKLMVISIRTVI